MQSPSVVKLSSLIGWKVSSGETECNFVGVKLIRMGFFSYFGHRVSFLLAPRARKKRALIVAAFTLVLSVSLETYIYSI